jgi:hypothetical protein
LLFTGIVDEYAVNLPTNHLFLDSTFLATKSLLLASLRLQFSIFLFGLSDVQTGTSGQGEVLYMDVSFRRYDIEDE